MRGKTKRNQRNAAGRERKKTGPEASPLREMRPNPDQKMGPFVRSDKDARNQFQSKTYTFFCLS